MFSPALPRLQVQASVSGQSNALSRDSSAAPSPRNNTWLTELHNGRMRRRGDQVPVTELQTEQPQLSTHQLPQQLTALSQQLSQSLTLDISANGISQCRICLTPAVDPVYPILGDGRPCDKYAENGRHWFCAACLQYAFTMNPCCPICKAEIEQMHWRGSIKNIMLRRVH